MQSIKNENGFSLSIIAVILVLVGLAGWLIWRATTIQPQANQPQAAENTSPATQNTSPSETESWKEYCLDLCFKYPPDWNLKATDLDLPAHVDLVEVTSPTQTTVQFLPVVEGLGGICEPDTCFFETLSIEQLKDPSLPDLRVVKGVFTNSIAYWPKYFITSKKIVEQLGLEAGRTDVGYFVGHFENVKDPTKISMFQVNTQGSTFTNDTAKQWFEKDDAKNVGKILLSTKLSAS